MTNFNKQIIPTIALLLTVIVAAVAYQGMAERQSASGPTQPSIIAAFDLEKTFNSLDEKKAADAALLKLAEDLQGGGTQQANDLKQQKEALEDLSRGSDKYSQLLEKLSQDSQYYQAYIEYCRVKIDIERARNMKRLYLTIRQAVDQMARENQYSVVFVDDSIAEIPPGNEEETNRQISARRMVYTSPEIDITDELINRMNKAFKDAGGVVPVAAPPTTTAPPLASPPPRASPTDTDSNAGTPSNKKPK